MAGLSALFGGTAGVLATRGTQDGASGDWNYWAIWFLVASAAVFLGYFALWPWVRWIDAWGARKIEQLGGVRAQPKRRSGSGLAVIKATYHDQDVTGPLNDRITNGRLDIPVTSAGIGVPDPAYGTRKTLSVKWSVDGVEKHGTWQDGEQLTLPPSGT